MSSFYYNTIYVIESLDSSEFHTGIKLYETVKTFEFKYPGVKTFLMLPATKIELFEVLSLINNSVQNHNFLPIIHLEMHGDSNGIECANKEFITWEELYPYLIEINIKLKNTLLITTGICFGANFYFKVDFNKPSPFFSLISSVAEISNKVILESYEGFYNELLRSENINNALNHLNLDFLRPTHNELILKPLIIGLINDYKKSIDNLPNLIKSFPIQLNDKAYNEIYNKSLDDYNHNFIDKLKSLWIKFLMLDLYPENQEGDKSINEFLIENINNTEIEEEFKINLIKIIKT
mgnify:CR=1 FL=1